MKISNIKNNKNGVYIGRGSPLGNPYKIGVDGDRDEVIQKYEDYLIKALANQDPVILSAMLGLKEFDTLLCHCDPLPCHGHVVAKYWERLSEYLPKPEGLIYTGIGARPESAKKPNGASSKDLKLMHKVAGRLDALGFTLRSGRATGSDQAFESASTRSEIFLPWKGFQSDFKADNAQFGVSSEAIRLANTVYPSDLQKAKDSIQALMARNCYQVLGHDLSTPSQFVVCWTSDGCEKEDQRTRGTGGTGQAIALANRFGVPVYNLSNPCAMDRLAAHVKRLTSVAAKPKRG